MLTMARYGARDLPRAGQFYDAIAGLLGASRVHESPEFICYQGGTGVMFAIGMPLAGAATFGNGVQLGFAAGSRSVVDAVHAKALESGGKDEGAPGLRGVPEAGFYAAYFRDLDGNKIMVYHRAAA
jgi:catechol 2,3-dioxygenase-like lactoylglutathione lyase family enzyme